MIIALKTYKIPKLKRTWAAAGTPNAVFCIKTNDLHKVQQP